MTTTTVDDPGDQEGPAGTGRSEFAALVEELLQPVGSVEVRSMFGGHGVFLDGVMFGSIASDALDLEDRRCEPRTVRAGRAGGIRL